MLIIDELSEDINLLINAINDGKRGIIHPQVLTPQTLIDEMREFESKFDIRYAIPLKETNFQHITDISLINVAIIKNRLVYSLHIPLLEQDTHEIKHLISIPKRLNSVFVAVIPDHEYIMFATEHSKYIPTDKGSLDQCKQYGQIKICKRKQPTYLMTETHSYENSILRANVKTIKGGMYILPF